MAAKGKTTGLILIVFGAGICLLMTVFLGVGMSTDRLSAAGAILGFMAFGFLPLAVFGGVGVYLYTSAKKESAELEIIRKKERILGLIQAQGQASVGSIMVEMKMDRQQVTDAIYELVAMNLFSGYIDWDALTFYSKDASAVGSNQCPNCGGVREFVGKGVIKCQYCGVSLFIPPDAPQTTATPAPPPEGKGLKEA